MNVDTSSTCVSLRLPLQRRRPRATGTAGFTLVELMVASVVLILGIASAVASLQIGFRTLDNARATTLAAQIVQSEIERVRLLSWTGINALPASEQLDLTSLFPAGRTRTEIINRFTAVRTVSDTADRGGLMKSITVTVTWRASNGATNTRVTTTRYTQNGLYDYLYTRSR
jgi:type II secretory pathway pseudopilin PulG